MKPSTLVIEDDPHIADVVEFLLVEMNHRVDRVTDGRRGWEVFAKGVYDLVILDLGLPGLPGMEVFQRIRSLRADQPVVMLTARGEEPDRVRGLSAGADDYICKPFSNAELAARVRNLLKRCPPANPVYSVGSLTLFPAEGQVRVGDWTVRLALHEFNLLETLVRSPDRAFTRDQLLDRMYEDRRDVLDRSVDQVVARLRRKLRPRLGGVNPVVSEYGVGYRIHRSGLEREA